MYGIGETFYWYVIIGFGLGLMCSLFGSLTKAIFTSFEGNSPKWEI